MESLDIWTLTVSFRNTVTSLSKTKTTSPTTTVLVFGDRPSSLEEMDFLTGNGSPITDESMIFGEKFIITLSKNSVKGIIAKTKKIIKSHICHTTLEMLRELNPVIRGWAYYHRHACSKKTFRYVDYCIFKNLWTWAKRRHSNKKVRWIRFRYFRSIGNREWCFFATQKT